MASVLFGSSTCSDSEGWSARSSREFDLTLCFEEGIVLSSLLVALLFAIVVRGCTLASRPVLARTTPSRRVLCAKLSILSAATALATANFVYLCIARPHVGVARFYLLEAIVFAAIPVLAFLEHTRARRSSTALLFFWPVYALATLVWTRTAISIHHSNPPPSQPHPSSPVPVNAIVRLVAVFLGLLSFALECAGSEIPEHGAHDDQPVFVEHPLTTANIFSQLSFGWMTPLMRRGVTQYITENDLPPLPHGDESVTLGERLHHAMTKHKSLWVALYTAFGGPFTAACGMKLVHDTLAFLQPQLLRWLLAFIAKYQGVHFGADDPSTTPSPYQGFAVAILMFVASIFQMFVLHQYFQRCFETGMRVRAALVTAIYHKALVLSSSARTLSSTGDIVNFMSVDAMRMQDLCTYALIAISGPYQVTLAFLSLYNLLGWSAFVGVVVMVLSVPLNALIARTLKKMQEKQMKNRDKRTRLMTELLANIKSIKLYAWEWTFIRRVLQVRNEEELKILRKIGVLNAGSNTLWMGIPLLVAFSSFTTAAFVSSRPLTPDVIFPAIALFNLLQFPLAMFAQVTSNIIEALVSVRRLTEFFASEELQPNARVVVLPPPNVVEGDGTEVLSIRDGEFWWSRDAREPTLQDINLKVRKGELVGILGRVGAGKTSLLSAVIGDMVRTEGEVVIRGSVAYASQNPWILSASVRDNILFSHEYDEDFYELVLDACALRQDLALLPQGDMTGVGEKGITLSGGQRARVALARAVYARADLVLIDDALAAVDNHVARHIFDNVIGPNGVLASKARVLVTNSVAFVRQFDQLAFVRRGIIIETGTFESLMSDPNTELHKLVASHGSSMNTASGSSTPWRSGTLSPTTASESQTLTDEKLGTVTEKLARRDSFGKAVLAPSPPVRGDVSDGPSKEHSEQGRVKPGVYLQYIKAASKTGFSFFMLASVLQQVLSIMANLTLRAWGDHNEETGDNSGRKMYLMVYGLFSLSSALVTGLGAILLWVFCSVRSSKYLHDSMLHAVMRAPLSFFELTPTGRILNLFSRDIYVVDLVLARVLSNFIRTMWSTTGIVIVIGASFPYFLISVVPLGYFYYRVMVYYLATSRELKRLDAVSRSPIFAWFSETLDGLSVIRAYNQQGVFVAANARRLDRNQICYLPSIAVNRWLAVRLEFVGSLIIFVAALLALTALITTGVDAGLVGLVLSYGLNTTGALNWLVRSASEVEQNIVSVERILHYVSLPPEAADEIPETKPDDAWPSEGSIEFRDYSLRYRPELDLVLKNISISIKPAEKIGVCGRTGAGKSSLLLALFRIIEPASGTIFIDGVDITTIGLHDLRSSISIVPQSPDLFEGAMRENIDPTGEYDDAEIWEALRQCHLKEFVESLPERLDAPVREGGSSLSSGQRQLLCFARALLRKSKILVLDEATSAVDLETDSAIQEIIRGPQFANTTMFTIAHRLNTIMESDRIMVLSAGEVTELDTPQALLGNADSQFRSLAAEAGLA